MTEIFELCLPGPSAAAGPVHPTLVKGRNALVLFDAGYPGQADAIEGELREAGFALGDLTHIVVSHQDHDHVGSLAELKRRNPSAIVVASALEAPYIAGEAESLRIGQAREYNRSLQGAERDWGEAFLRYLSTIEPCAVDRPVGDFPEAIDEGIEILWTPGHTPGHVSLLVKDLKTLLAGDALARGNGSLAIANPQFTLDLATCGRTIRSVAGLGLDRILCYHGGAADVADGKALGELVASLGA